MLHLKEGFRSLGRRIKLMRLYWQADGVITKGELRDLGYEKTWQQKSLRIIRGGVVVFQVIWNGLKRALEFVIDNAEIVGGVIVGGIIALFIGFVGWFLWTHECTQSHIEHRVVEAHYDRRCSVRDDDFNCIAWNNVYVPRREWDETVCDKWERRDRFQQ